MKSHVVGPKFGASPAMPCSKLFTELVTLAPQRNLLKMDLKFIGKMARYPWDGGPLNNQLPFHTLYASSGIEYTIVYPI